MGKGFVNFSWALVVAVPMSTIHSELHSLRAPFVPSTSVFLFLYCYMLVVIWYNQVTRSPHDLFRTFPVCWFNQHLEKSNE